jgi:flagellar motility protein MotE (MotC chaperone)
MSPTEITTAALNGRLDQVKAELDDVKRDLATLADRLEARLALFEEEADRIVTAAEQSADVW